MFWGAYPKIYQHEWHSHITGFHHNLVKLETKMFYLLIKRFPYSFAFNDSLVQQGFLSPLPAHIQNTHKKEIPRHHIFPMMKLVPFRNDSKRDCVCMCVCVCPHHREAAVIASGCTPLYVSDLGLMKLKAWQLWGASADPQSDGHLILPPRPRGAAYIWGPCLLFAQWLGAPVYPCCRRSCHICCGCHLEGLLDCHSTLSCYAELVYNSEADQIHVFWKWYCQAFCLFV